MGGCSRACNVGVGGGRPGGSRRQHLGYQAQGIYLQNWNSTWSGIPPHPARVVIYPPRNLTCIRCDIRLFSRHVTPSSPTSHHPRSEQMRKLRYCDTGKQETPSREDVLRWRKNDQAPRGLLRDPWDSYGPERSTMVALVCGRSTTHLATRTPCRQLRRPQRQVPSLQGAGWSRHPEAAPL